MFPYEKLEVYKRAYSANQEIYRFLKGNKSITTYIRDQLGRASLSIMLNIAEGSAKFSDRDRKNFFITARGSAFECSSLVTFMQEEGDMPAILAVQINSSFEEISRMLYTMIKNLEEKVQ